ncbi:SUN domain-containing protein 1 [Lotus japonicus]|uniref:SUN domain-containing protein 1 n=1 Tax=Lotus japonicus TaxID=34305 RepID=UPI00258B9BE8|nr:SUN domain-containing protein 1 [Lotus japonicus]
MSASTLSITAANPGTRRRPVIAADKKTASNLELLANDVAVSPAAVDAKTPSAGRDLSHHSIRGEAYLEPAAKTVSTAVPVRRARKSPTKAEKPRWVTVARILAKNFVLLVVLAGLIQLIRRLALKSDDVAVVGYSGLSEFEGKISDMEGLLKNTARMIQVQVDVMDKKIEDGVSGLRKEFDVKIEEKGAYLEGELKNLESKGEKLERYLSELKAENWLSKEEFEKFVVDLRKVKGNGYEGGGLDEIREFAKGVIRKEIEKHAADGLGMVDYALGSGGAAVVRHSEPYDVRRGNWLSLLSSVHPNADKMLKPSFGEPGQCFPLKGSSGFVQIRLRTDIIPEAVTLEHIAKSVAYDRSSAPKDCRISGWLQGRNADSIVDTEKMFLLTEFSYDLEKSNAQTFNVLNSAGSGVINTIRLDFTSNHGNPSHTCIYRLRVHGHEPESVSMMALQS